MKVIGITGPTGAGKTTALNALRSLGGQIIDADAVYHDLTRSSPALRAELDSLPVVKKTAPAEEFSTVKKQTVENEDAFLRKLNAGEKVIAIELDSPRTADLTGYLEGAKKLQAAGADLLTQLDCHDIQV